MYKLMKWTLLFSFCNIYVVMSQKTENRETYITSDQTENVDVYPQMTSLFPTYVYEWKKTSSPHRSTIVNRGDLVNFKIVKANPKKKYKWTIYRAARDVEEFDAETKIYRIGYVNKRLAKKKVAIELPGKSQKQVRRLELAFKSKRKTNEFNWVFDKISYDDLNHKNPEWNHLIYDLYVVNLYEGRKQIDFMYVFVLPEADVTYIEHFDETINPADGAGNFRPVAYPLWYGHGYNLIEHLDATHFGIVSEKHSLKNPTRKGPRMVNNTIPAVSELAVQPKTAKEKYWSRSARNSILHAPNQVVGTDTYYGISLRIPEKQDWRWITKDKNNTNIIIDMHTAHFPNRELKENEGGNLHITYLGGDKFGLGYGVAKIAKFQKHFYLPNHEGKWVDFVFRYVYKNIKHEQLSKNRTLTEKDGVFEMWVSVGDDNFKKVSFEENTFPKGVKIDGRIDSQKGIYVPNLSQDKTTVYGPNIANTNPIYLLMVTQYRIGKNGPMLVDVSNTIYYDEFITADDFNTVLKHFGKKVDGVSEFSERR